MSNGLVTNYASFILLGFVFFVTVYTSSPGFTGLVLCIIIASVVTSFNSNEESEQFLTSGK